jgi:hypothetical protein
MYRAGSGTQPVIVTDVGALITIDLADGQWT